MMMDILMYLFETYIHSDAELQVNQDELEEELKNSLDNEVDEK